MTNARRCMILCCIISAASGDNLIVGNGTVDQAKGVYTKRDFTYQGYQLPPFSQLAHGLSSGPITILDNRTFFVTDLHYDGKAPDSHFWVGNGTEPGRDGILVPDENGSTENLQAYNGKNVTIRLPNNLTIDEIDYFGMWCIRFAQNFGHVVMPWALKREGNNTVSNKTIVNVPKCCPLKQVLTQNGCTVLNRLFNPRINVHEHNSTHLNDEPLKAVVFEPFVSSISCSNQKYPLIPGEDKFALLQNGSLMILNKQEMLPQDGYCIETVNLNEGAGSNWITTPIVCFNNAEVPLAGTVFIVYAGGVLLSAIFLIVTALVFLFVKEARDTRGKCVVGYAVAMAIAFICLASAQLSGIGEQTCATFGFLIQFFLAASFTWLSCLSWETYLKIKKYNTDEYSQDRKRLYWYLGIGFFVPLGILLMTLIFDRMPAIPSTLFKPQFGKNSCWFDQKQWTMVYFYLPIAAAIIFNIVLSVSMKINLVWMDRHCREDIAWLAVKQDLKPMYRSCGFLLALMTLSWVMEIVSFLAQTDSGIWTAIDIVNSLQGFLVFLIFVLHRPVKDKLRVCAIKMSRRKIQYDKAGEEDIRLNGFNGHNEFLTKLNRSESAEQIS